MIKKWSFWLAVMAFSTLFSCSVNTETTYYKDSASGLNLDIKMDKMFLNGIKEYLKDSSQTDKIPDFKNLTTEWQNLYDLAKNKGKVPSVTSDSAKVMKQIFMKLNKENGEVSGVSLKYYHLFPKDIAMAFKDKPGKSMGHMGSWDGKKLTLDIGEIALGDLYDDTEKDKKPSTKKDSLEAAGRMIGKGMMDMLKTFDMHFKNRLKFENKIKKIEGKSDFLKQIDDKTLELNYRLNDFDEKKKHQDKIIIITTE